MSSSGDPGGSVLDTLRLGSVWSGWTSYDLRLKTSPPSVTSALSFTVANIFNIWCWMKLQSQTEVKLLEMAEGPQTPEGKRSSAKLPSMLPAVHQHVSHRTECVCCQHFHAVCSNKRSFSIICPSSTYISSLFQYNVMLPCFFVCLFE